MIQGTAESAVGIQNLFIPAYISDYGPKPRMPREALFNSWKPVLRLKSSPTVLRTRPSIPAAGSYPHPRVARHESGQ